MNNKAINEFRFPRIWRIKQEEGTCYPQMPKAKVDNILWDLLNSSYPTQPHSLIAN